MDGLGKIVTIIGLLIIIIAISVVDTIVIKELRDDIKYYQNQSEVIEVSREKEKYKDAKELLFVLHKLTEKYPKDKKLEDITQKVFFDVLCYQMRQNLKDIKDESNKNK